MKNKIQILHIHGGMTFKNKNDYIYFLKHRKISLERKNKWSGDWLEKTLGKNFQIVRPRMPLQDNASYKDWAINFEKYFHLLGNKIILIGESLGGVFLAKYLSENKLTKKIISVYLVCPPFDDTLSGEDLAGGFKLKPNLSLLEKNSPKLYLLFSKQDDVVPLAHAKKYASRLKRAKIILFKNIQGHFQISKFPEIIKMIKRDIK